MDELYSVVYVCVCTLTYTTSSLFTHLVDGHLGCSHVLTTVNSGVVNIGVHASF